MSERRKNEVRRGWLSPQTICAILSGTAGSSKSEVLSSQHLLLAAQPSCWGIKPLGDSWLGLTGPTLALLLGELASACPLG